MSRPPSGLLHQNPCHRHIATCIQPILLPVSTWNSNSSSKLVLELRWISYTYTVNQEHTHMITGVMKRHHLEQPLQQLIKSERESENFFRSLLTVRVNTTLNFLSNPSESDVAFAFPLVQSKCTLSVSLWQTPWLLTDPRYCFCFRMVANANHFPGPKVHVCVQSCAGILAGLPGGTQSYVLFSSQFWTTTPIADNW